VDPSDLEDLKVIGDPKVVEVQKVSGVWMDVRDHRDLWVVMDPQEQEVLMVSPAHLVQLVPQVLQVCQVQLVLQELV
jgi:hypothetical protein